MIATECRPQLSITSAEHTPQAKADHERGIALNRQGRFAEALPLLENMQDGSYLVEFNLGLAYLGVGNDTAAIRVLKALRQTDGDTAAVNNLLAQAYLGSAQTELGYQSFLRAAKQTPNDEKLYAYVADACTDHALYGLGLRVVDVGLTHLPGSSRLYYERAVFLARMDRMGEARSEFARAIALDPESDIAYLARVQQELYDDKLEEAVRVARQGIASGRRSAQMLELLGETLLHNGAAPGQPEFAEARDALQASVAANPLFSTAQLNLGKVCLMEGRPRDAVDHLEAAARLEPLNPTIYSNLTTAYRQLGDKDHAKQSTAKLARLLHAQ